MHIADRIKYLFILLDFNLLWYSMKRLNTMLELSDIQMSRFVSWQKQLFNIIKYAVFDYRLLPEDDELERELLPELLLEPELLELLELPE